MRAAPSLRSRLTWAVGIAMFAAVLAPALVLVSASAPAAWTSVVFVVGFVVTSLVLLAGCLAVAHVFVRALTAPIEAMAARLDVLAESGVDLPSTTDQTFAELERLLESVRHLVAASRAREHRLETAVGALAHDVRTGLRAIATVVGQGRAAPGGDVRLAAATADQVERELERARTMASDLVVLMRESEVRFAAAGPAVDVAVLAREVADASAVGSGVRIEVEVVKPFVRSASRALMERTLRNILDNAVRHARSSVLVRVFDGLVVVADDGPGFGRRDVSATAVGLHGYGFEIASRLAELVGGRVAIEASNDRGTTVLVYL